MISRKPRATTSAAAPYFTQLVAASENRPWIRTTGLPSPVSCQTRSAPSSAANWGVAISIGEAVITDPKLTKFTPSFGANNFPRVRYSLSLVEGNPEPVKHGRASGGDIVGRDVLNAGVA